jgi:hypothetical protein
MQTVGARLEHRRLPVPRRLYAAVWGCTRKRRLLYFTAVLLSAENHRRLPDAGNDGLSGGRLDGKRGGR